MGDGFEEEEAEDEGREEGWNRGADNGSSSPAAVDDIGVVDTVEAETGEMG